MGFNMIRLLFCISLLTLASCGPTTSASPDREAGPKQQIGAITGMIVGGALANDMAEGSKNEGMATILGAFIGGVMGQSIGSQLDTLDRQLAQSAYSEALEYNKSNVTSDWVNPDSGNSGSFTPRRTYSNGGRYCREYTQEIIIGGKKQSGYGTACRQPDGSWEIIS
jgi:surface antigen